MSNSGHVVCSAKNKKQQRIDVLFMYTCEQAHRESTGTISPADISNGDPVAAAEEIAFCKACARFGLGLYLYHED